MPWRFHAETKTARDKSAKLDAGEEGEEIPKGEHKLSVPALGKQCQGAYHHRFMRQSNLFPYKLAHHGVNARLAL